jgi:hypothetical protein
LLASIRDVPIAHINIENQFDDYKMKLRKLLLAIASCAPIFYSSTFEKLSRYGRQLSQDDHVVSNAISADNFYLISKYTIRGGLM